MSTLTCCLSLFLGAGLPFAASAAQVQFTDYRAFYESLGSNLFAGPGMELAMTCSESPRHCLWVNAMRPAFERYDQALWSAPDGLPLKPPKGTPEIVFDGKALAIGKQRWPLRDVSNLATPAWRVGDPVDPENVASATVWRQGTSACLEMQYVSSGYGDRYPQVLLLHGQHLYALPRLFASCASVRKAPHNQFSYPDNSYLGPERENNPTGLKMDYLLPDGKTPVAQYLLHFPNQGDPFVFEVQRQ
ncbi:hypothetical protein JFT91_02010 [Pseudomonas sp. TH08]|uniref:hypothetical protein n=1 Tax=unclassified Pseudomonas TaxID=196821 RepID=UPI0019123A11|nr:MULTISPECIES: hypothetical protein [unclassified Pseudomonas]MBK5527359.1 hypothetical protein [Pseudomonas sp. TH06]MBK5531388.1 hypothetical protein [Pseudomonas sp. TH08]